jgi:hypothetical protein
MPALSKNAQCILKILGDLGALTTTEILEAVSNQKYANICTDCAGGDTFVVTVNQLVEQGLVQKTFGKGGYRWCLIKE